MTFGQGSRPTLPGIKRVYGKEDALQLQRWVEEMMGQLPNIKADDDMSNDIQGRSNHKQFMLR
jgi:hypothetical protein